MAKFEKAKNLNEWMDQRLAVNTLKKVMNTEYWIPIQAGCSNSI